jgi:shikimate kinase
MEARAATGGLLVTENEEKRLQSIREKMAQMKAREQAIIANDKKRQRKERTRRLIQLGALVEKYLDCPGIEPGEFEKVLREMVGKG